MMRPSPTRVLLLVCGATLAACSGSGGDADAGTGTTTLTLGEAVDEQFCEADVDCPPGYRCVIPTCQPIDNDADNDGYDAAVDCDDQDSSVHPGKEEACNGKDENCNGATDEGVLNACGACGPVPMEICDLLDNDCNGVVDDGCTPGRVGEMEPNDGSTNCQQVALPTEAGTTITLTGAISPAGDVDSYCFFAAASYSYTFDVDSQSLGAPTDSVLQLFDRVTGMQLPGGYNDYAMGPDPLLPYTFAQDGEFRLDIYNAEINRGGPQHTYELKITLDVIPQCDDADQDGVTTCHADCKDDDVLIFPGQTEVCDGTDNNCDGVVDEGCPDLRRPEVESNNTVTACEFLSFPFTLSGAISPRRDADVFCFFAASGEQVAFDIDAKEEPFGSLLDSNLRLLRMPGDELAVNDDGADPDTGYLAEDSDSFLTFTFAIPGIYAVEVTDTRTSQGGARYHYTLRGYRPVEPTCTDADGDGVTTCEGDCRDDDPDVHFGHLEVCDGKDNDCNNVGDSNRCSGDFDGDGVSGAMGDCDDSDPTINPQAAEICDLVDNNCDGQVDEGVKNACGTCGNPPPERCGDGVDNDCDGVTDTDCDDDADGDLVTADAGDCDDGNADVNPAATEVCDGIDNNCDGLIDEFVKNACGECAPEREEVCDGQDNNCNGLIDDGTLNACGECGPPPMEVCDEQDNDCDGLIDEDLTNACGTCGPAPAEVCDNVDNNCDGTTDEGCDVDFDMDGQTPRQGDCNDRNFSILSGIDDVCDDGIDNNCNGRVDEAPTCPIPVEVEPNSNRTQCGQLRIPGAFTGAVTSASDLDVYCFTIPTAGMRVSFNVDAQKNGSPLDAFMEVLNATGTALAINNDGVEPPAMVPTKDPYVELTFMEAGTYSVQLKAATTTPTTAGANATYTLRTEVVSGCVDLDKDGMLRCEDDCNDHDARVHPGAVDICDGADNNCNMVIDDRCVNGCLDDVLEDNDTFNTAAPLSMGPRADLAYCGGDQDYYVVELTETAALQVDLRFSHAAANLGLEILDDQLNPLGTSDDMDDDEQLVLSALAPGEYYVRVFGRLTSTTYAIEVAVTP